MGTRGSRNKEKVIHSESSIQKLLYYKEPVITNPKYVTIGLFMFGWESDYMAISRSGYTYEAEIKISHNDFLNEAKNKKRKLSVLRGEREEKRPNYFYYVCPTGIISVEELPDYAGLIYINDNRFTVVVNAPKLHKEKDVFTDEYLSKKFYYGMWNYINRKWKTNK